MKRRDRSFKFMCCLCVGLALSTCTYELCIAESLEGSPASDATESEAGPVRLMESRFLAETPADSLGSEGETEIKPVYRRWWVWALVTTGIAVLAVLAGGTDEKKVEEDLPGFPDPPNR
jgi:hypothetical protein